MNQEKTENPPEALNASGMGCAPLTVSAALQWSEWLIEQLKQVAESSAVNSGAGAAWATQGMLAVRWGMKKTAISKYIQAGVSAGKVRAVQPDDGVKKGFTRYSVEDFDAFMIGEEKAGGKVWN